jgi:hypothetical protein
MQYMYIYVYLIYVYVYMYIYLILNLISQNSVIVITLYLLYGEHIK